MQLTHIDTSEVSESHESVELIAGLLGDTTRDEILLGCARAIAARGIRDTTVQDILDASGRSRRTFYQCFSNKDEALEALYALLCESLVQNVTLAAVRCSTDAPMEGIGLILDVYLTAQRRMGVLALELHAEASRPDSGLAPTREAIVARLVDFYHQLARDELGVDLDRMAYYVLTQGIEELVMHQMRQGAFEDEADQTRVYDATMGMIRRLLG